MPFPSIFTTVPTKSCDIQRMYGLHSSEVRSICSNMRQKGIPVCSNHYGYYISQDTKEIQQTINHLQSRIKAMQLCVSGLEKYLSEHHLW